MTRGSSLVLFTILLAGCQSAYQALPPIDLEDRLARVEERRLTPDAVSAQYARLTMVPVGATGHAIANGPPTMAVQVAVAEQHRWQDDLATMTLGDMGDPQAATDSTSVTTKHETTSTEDKYVRKPPLRSFWETASRDIKDMPCDLWRDTKRVYANPVNLAILGVAYGGSLAIQETGPDSTVEHRFNRNHDFREPDHIFNNSDWRDAFGAAGSPATHFALAGAWYLLGQQTMDDKTYEVGKTLFSGLIINGMTVMVGQAASYDRAPNGEHGTFPSGHTSSSFVMASVLDKAYGHLVGAPLYGLASLVAIERLDDREHYLSDVVMGAVLGTVIGHSVADGRDPEFFGWKLLPYASPGSGAGIAFMKSVE